MSWSINFLAGWSYINATVGGGTANIQVPFGVGSDITSGRFSYGEMLSTNVGNVIAGFQSLGNQQIGAELVKMDDNFQDPELKQQIGEAAQVLENPKVKPKLDQAIERQSGSGKHKKWT